MIKKIIYSSLVAIFVFSACGGGDGSDNKIKDEMQDESNSSNDKNKPNEITLQTKNISTKVDIKFLHQENIQRLIDLLNKKGYLNFSNKTFNSVYSDFDENGKEYYVVTFNENGYILLDSDINHNAIYNFDENKIYSSVKSQNMTNIVSVDWMSIIAEEVNIPFPKLQKNYQKQNRKLVTKITWTSGSQRSDFDLFVKSPDGQMCNYQSDNKNREAWGTKHLRDDIGGAYEKSFEAYSVDLDKMDEYASKNNLFGKDQGRFKFYTARYAGPNISYNFSYGFSGECSTNTANDCSRGNWVRNVSNTGIDNALYAVRYTPKKVSTNTNEDRIPKIEEIPYIMRKIGWNFAAELMNYWFEGSGANYFVDLNNMENKFPIIKDAVEEYREDAKNSYLGEIEKSYLRSSLKNIDGLFYFIKDEINLAGEGWYPSVFNDEKKNMNWIGEQALSHWKVDEYTAAFNKSVIRLVVNGVVEKNQNGSKKAFLSKFGIYLRDSYDFYDENNNEDSQDLACWSLKSPYVSHPYFKSKLSNPLCVSNKSFRDYNILHGYNEHHGNYRIFSIPIEVSPESLTPINLN